MNIFHQAAPDIDISDKTGEGAVEDAPYASSQHGHGLKVTRLQLNTYNPRDMVQVLGNSWKYCPKINTCLFKV